VGITAGGGHYKDEWLVYKSVEVNEYLVKAKLGPAAIKSICFSYLDHPARITSQSHANARTAETALVPAGV